MYKRPPVHRACIDSLRIPVTRTCVLPPSSKPKLFHPPCLQSSEAMKHPICHCDDFSTADTCCSSTSCRRSPSPYRQDYRDEDNVKSFRPHRQEDGCKSVDNYEFDIPCSREVSGNSEQQGVDETASNNEETSCRSPVCPLSYTPSLTNQNANAMPNYKSQGQRAQVQNILSKDCLKSSPVTGFSSKGITAKLNKTSMSLSKTHNIGRHDPTERNFRNTEDVISSEARCGRNQFPNSVSQFQDFSQDRNKIPSSDDEEQNSDESFCSLCEVNACCPRNFQASKSNSTEDVDFQTNQNYIDRQTNVIKASKTTMTDENINNNECQSCCYDSYIDQQKNVTKSSRITMNDENINNNECQSCCFDSKQDLPSTGIAPNRNSIGRTSLSFGSPKPVVKPTDEQLKNTLNISSVNNMCRKCKSMSKHTTLNGVTTSKSRIHTADDALGENQHAHINPGLSSKRNLIQGRSKQFGVDENQQLSSDSTSKTNPCCVKGTKQTGSGVRQSDFVKPSANNMLLKNDIIDIQPAQRSKETVYANTNTYEQRLSDDTSRDYSTCCETHDSRPINKVNIPQESNSNLAKFNSQSGFSAQGKQSGTIDNFGSTKRPKQISGCCDHGISRLIPTESQIRKKVADINCACPDFNKSQHKKKATHEIGAMSCTSTSCVVNETSGCRCRYPPAFKQFSCTGNISGSCNCSDDI